MKVRVSLVVEFDAEKLGVDSYSDAENCAAHAAIHYLRGGSIDEVGPPITFEILKEEE